MVDIGPLYDLEKFKESRFQTFNHGVRVYIYGSNISAWIKGGVSVTYNNRDSYNTASFELSNPHKIWQLTPDNLAGNFNLNVSEFSEGPKQKIFVRKNDPDVNPYFTLDVTKSELGGKQRNTAFKSEGKTPLLAPTLSQERRYRLAVNDAIFNKGDHARIFIKNPYRANDNEWMEVFCGFVQDCLVSTDFKTGESTVKIALSCIKQQMAKMRVQTNIHIGSIDPQPLFSDSFYQDFINAGIYTHPFAVSSLEQTIKTLVLGTPNPPRNENLTEVNTNGVGTFKLGNVVCYDANAPGNLLERWHLMTMFGVNKSAFPSGFNENLWLSAKEMNAIGEATYPHLNPICAGPTGRYLHMLLPKTGTGPGSLASHEVAKDVTDKREWSSRWEVIREFASKLDFQVMTSPSGDILVEFPQYGFTPCIYKNKPLTECNTPTGWASVFTFDLHQKEETLNDEAEDFPTLLTVGGGQANSKVDPQVGANYQPRAYIFSPPLVSRYGVISEEYSVPYAGQKDTDVGSGPNSPLTKRLAQLGLIEYTKRLANASSWSGSCVFRPFIFPNRPIELKRTARVGNITSVTNTWNVPVSAETSFNLNCLMYLRYSSDGSLDYRLLTGATNMPIDYASIWGANGIQTAVDQGNVGDVDVSDPQKFMGVNELNKADPDYVLELVKKFEGYRAKEYLDAAGRPTIGYGHLIKAPETTKKILSKYDKDGDKSLSVPEATALFRLDIAQHQSFRAKIKFPLTSLQEAALTSLEYNVGGSTPIWDTLIPYINNKQFKEAADWIANAPYGRNIKLKDASTGKYVSKPLEPLIRRRLLERSLFLEGSDLVASNAPTDPKNQPFAASSSSGGGAAPSVPKVGDEAISAAGTGVHAKTGSNQQGSSSAKEAPSSGDAKSKGKVKAKPNVSLGGLYPPFGDRIGTLLAEAANRNIDAYAGDTRRSPNQQSSATESDQFYFLHRFGLAADIYIRGKSGSKGYSTNLADYEPLGTIMLDNSLELDWAGSGAPWHFEAPKSWISPNTASAIFEGAKEQGKSDSEAVEEVWRAIDASTPGLKTPEQDKPAVTGAAPIGGDSGLGEAASPCTESLLETPGYRG